MRKSKYASGLARGTVCIAYIYQCKAICKVYICLSKAHLTVLNIIVDIYKYSRHFKKYIDIFMQP